MPSGGPGFGFETTAAEVVAGLDLSGLRAIVTGASSGIGIETARALAVAGAEVTIPVRDLAAGGRVAADIVAAGDGARAPVVRVDHLDLADLGSAAAFAARWSDPLDILIANAGIMFTPERTLTAAGVELHFAVNHLGHFALAVGLHDALAAARGARIVSVSSRAHLRSPVVFDDIHFERRPYDPVLAYAQSKTANILFAVEATRRCAADGITANAVMPGTITATRLTRHMRPEEIAAALATGTHDVKTLQQGAATSTYVAVSPEIEGVGGRCYWDCRQLPVVEPDPGATGVAPHALDPDAAGRLWEVSRDLLGRNAR